MSRSSSFASYSSDDDSSVPLSEQAEWKDIVPIDQDDGVHPICPIAYTADYKELMGYFRAIMSTGEISPRAYRLTSRVIQENPAHYTVWVYRKKLLEELQISVESELDWLEGVAQQYPKNYQPWHHRQMLLTMLLDPAVFAGMSEDQRVCHPAIRRELRFLANAIDVESKNFHAWSYRQWLVRRYGIWDQERVFLTTMIDQDVRNNSAWNQRYFVLVRGAEDPQNVELLDQASLIEEIEFALEMARRAPNNESPWAYIVGLMLRHAPEKMTTELLPRVQALAAAGEECAVAVGASAFYWSALVDIYERQAELAAGDKEREAAIALAQSACEALAAEYDPVRMRYWEFRAKALLALTQ